MAADILSFLRQVGEERSVTHVVADLLRYAGQTFDVHRISLFVADEQTGRLRPFLSEFPSGAVDRELFDTWRSLEVEGTALVESIRAGDDLLLVDPPDGPAGLPADAVERFAMRPLLALALRQSSGLEGLLVIEADRRRLELVRDDALLLRDHLALALANTRAYEREIARAAEAEALLEVTKVLARTTALTPVLVAVARQSARVSGFERCSLFLLDEQEQRLVPTMSQFADGHHDPEAWQRFVANETDLPIAWEVMRTRRPVAVERPRERPELMPAVWVDPFDIAAVVYLPLVAWGECFGILVLDHRRPTSISDQQLRMAEAVASQGAVAIGVGQLLERLRRANEHLEQADTAKDDFLSMLSHELRNPVTSVLGFAATLERSWDRLQPAKRNDLLGRIRSNAERQVRMIDDLLQTSRIVSGDLDVRTRTVPLGPLVDDALAHLDLPPGVVAVDAESAVVRVDPDHIRQVVTNLVTNACKYGRPPIEVAVRQTGRTVELVVRDHGDGVPPEFVAELFERFSQARRGTEEPGSGVGLGLAIARRLARANGGDLRYEGGHDGAFFVLELPTA